MAERARRFLRHLDFAVLQPVNQLVRRQVDELDLGALEYAVGHRLADADAGKAGDDVVEAFDMLDIERRIDVDPGVEQFGDILPTLGVAAAFDRFTRE